MCLIFIQNAIVIYNILYVVSTGIVVYSLNMDLKTCLGKKIQELRKARGLTQEKLAELMDLTPMQ